MTVTSVRSLALGSALALSFLAGCSRTPHPEPAGAAASAATVSDADAILASLDAGNVAAASKRLNAALKRAPMDPALLVLRDSIDKDPKLLLGPQSFAYTVQPGDTLTGLAERFLGNRIKSYQLARYNGLATPVALTPGQTLRIPGEAPRLEPVTPRLVPPRPRIGPPATTTVPPRPVATPKPAAPRTDPAAAARLRAAGLTALNQGSIGNAVALLRRAAALEPGNGQIARDLARAERIAAQVKARRQP